MSPFNSPVACLCRAALRTRFRRAYAVFIVEQLHRLQHEFMVRIRSSADQCHEHHEDRNYNE